MMSASPDDVASLIEERELAVALQLSFFRSSCVQRTRLMERRRRTASCIRRMCITWRYAPYIILPRVAAALPAGFGQSPHRSPPTRRSAPKKHKHSSAKGASCAPTSTLSQPYARTQKPSPAPRARSGKVAAEGRRMRVWFFPSGRTLEPRGGAAFGGTPTGL